MPGKESIKSAGNPGSLKWEVPLFPLVRGSEDKYGGWPKFIGGTPDWTQRFSPGKEQELPGNGTPVCAED